MARHDAGLTCLALVSCLSFHHSLHVIRRYGLMRASPSLTQRFCSTMALITGSARTNHLKQPNIPVASTCSPRSRRLSCRRSGRKLPSVSGRTTYLLERGQLHFARQLMRINFTCSSTSLEGVDISRLCRMTWTLRSGLFLRDSFSCRRTDGTDRCVEARVLSVFFVVPVVH